MLPNILHTIIHCKRRLSIILLDHDLAIKVDYFVIWMNNIISEHLRSRNLLQIKTIYFYI